MLRFDPTIEYVHNSLNNITLESVQSAADNIASTSIHARLLPIRAKEKYLANLLNVERSEVPKEIQKFFNAVPDILTHIEDFNESRTKINNLIKGFDGSKKQLKTIEYREVGTDLEIYYSGEDKEFKDYAAIADNLSYLLNIKKHFGNFAKYWEKVEEVSKGNQSYEKAFDSINKFFNYLESNRNQIESIFTIDNNNKSITVKTKFWKLFNTESGINKLKGITNGWIQELLKTSALELGDTKFENGKLIHSGSLLLKNNSPVDIKSYFQVTTNATIAINMELKRLSLDSRYGVRLDKKHFNVGKEVKQTRYKINPETKELEAVDGYRSVLQSPLLLKDRDFITFAQIVNLRYNNNYNFMKVKISKAPFTKMLYEAIPSYVERLVSKAIVSEDIPLIIIIRDKVGWYSDYLEEYWTAALKSPRKVFSFSSKKLPMNAKQLRQRKIDFLQLHRRGAAEAFKINDFRKEYSRQASSDVNLAYQNLKSFTITAAMFTYPTRL